MRIITHALYRAQQDPEMAKAYPVSYLGTVVREDETHIWLRMGMNKGKNKRRTVAIPRANIVTTVNR